MVSRLKGVCRPGMHYLSDSDVLELRGEGEDSEQLYLTEGWLQHLVVGGHCLVG